MNYPFSSDVRERAKQLRGKFNHANHGRNYFMPFFSGGPEDFVRELHDRAVSYGANGVADELFHSENGCCAYNYMTKMVFVPPDVSQDAHIVLNKMGYSTVILACIRSGFLAKLLEETDVSKLMRLFKHMRYAHDACVYAIGYDKNDPLDKNKMLRRFISDNGLRSIRTRPGYGLATAICNAKHDLDGAIFSRTLFIDNNREADTANGAESGFDVARTARAAPLIGDLFFKCPKCYEPWTAEIPFNMLFTDTANSF